MPARGGLRARHQQEVLAAVLPCDDARPLFDWLRSLGFMQSSERGLRPHELVREVLVADTMWRDPKRADALRRAACRHFYGASRNSSGRARLHHQAEVLYVLRHQPHKEKFFDWSALDVHRVEPARDEDLPEWRDGRAPRGPRRAAAGSPIGGSTSARAFSCSGTPTGECDGFMLMLRMTGDTPASERADPAVAAALRFIERHRPLSGADELVCCASGCMRSIIKRSARRSI